MPLAVARSPMLVVVLLNLTACSSTDQRFSAWCEKWQQEGWRAGEIGQNDKQLCSMQDALSDSDKEALMQMSAELETEKTKMNEIEEEGRAKGYAH